MWCKALKVYFLLFLHCFISVYVYWTCIIIVLENSPLILVLFLSQFPPFSSYCILFYIIHSLFQVSNAPTSDWLNRWAGTRLACMGQVIRLFRFALAPLTIILTPLLWMQHGSNVWSFLIRYPKHRCPSPEVGIAFVCTRASLLTEVHLYTRLSLHAF